MKHLELKVPPLVWVAIFAICMWACAKWLPSLSFALPHSRSIGGSIALLGLLIAVSGIVTFRRSATTVNPLSPSQATSLVQDGPYRFTRNPMYLGMLLVLTGWFFVLQNLAALAFIGCYVLTITELQIHPEERALTETFGGEYREYTHKVSRWCGARRLLPQESEERPDV